MLWPIFRMTLSILLILLILIVGIDDTDSTDQHKSRYWYFVKNPGRTIKSQSWHDTTSYGQVE